MAQLHDLPSYLIRVDPLTKADPMECASDVTVLDHR
jgi:hypothetical protein